MRHRYCLFALCLAALACGNGDSAGSGTSPGALASGGSSGNGGSGGSAGAIAANGGSGGDTGGAGADCSAERAAFVAAVHGNRACAQDSDCTQLIEPCLAAEAQNCAGIFYVAKSGSAAIWAAQTAYESCAGASCGAGGTCGLGAVEPSCKGGVCGGEPGGGPPCEPPFPLLHGDPSCAPDAPTSASCANEGASCVYAEIAGGASTDCRPYLCRCESGVWACVHTDAAGTTTCPVVTLPKEEPCADAADLPCSYVSWTGTIASCTCGSAGWSCAFLVGLFVGPILAPAEFPAGAPVAPVRRVRRASTASVVVAAQIVTASHTARAEATTPESYAWQVLAVDAAALTSFTAGVSSRSAALTYAGLGSYVVAAPVIHAALGRGRTGAYDMLARLGAPFVGFVAGLALGGQTHGCDNGRDNGSSCALQGAFGGTVVTMAAWTIVDSQAFAWKDVKVTPAVSVDRTGVSFRIAASF